MRVALLILPLAFTLLAGAHGQLLGNVHKHDDASSCSMKNFQDRTDEVDAVCCGGPNAAADACASGVPTVVTALSTATVAPSSGPAVRTKAARACGSATQAKVGSTSKVSNTFKDGLGESGWVAFAGAPLPPY